jgi:PAS domain S-box-containing protein
MADHIATTIAVDGLDRRAESGPAVLYVAELAGEDIHVRWVSDNFERVLGHSPHACLNDPDWWLDQFHPDDKAAALERWSNFPTTEQVASEYRFCHGDDRYRWISDNVNIVTGEPGAPIQVVGALIDVTDRKDIVDAVGRANDRLNFLLSDGPGVIFTCKPWGALETTFISESVTRLLGYQPEACVAYPSFWVDRLHPDERESVLAGLHRLFEQGHYSHEYRYRVQSGEYRWLRGDLRLVCDAAGKPAEIVGVMFDIAGLKRAESDLSESETRYRELFEAAPVSLWEEDWSSVKVVVDRLRRDGVRNLRQHLKDNPDVVVEMIKGIEFLDVNPVTLDIYRQPDKAKLLARTSDSLGQVPSPRFDEWVADLAEGARRVTDQFLDQRYDGTALHSRVSFRIPEARRDDWSRLLVSLEDITERKNVDDALRQSEARYRELFEVSPVAVFEADWSRLKSMVEGLRSNGVVDFAAHFAVHPEFLDQASAVCEFIDVNSAAIKMYGAKDKSELIASVNAMIRQSSFEGFADRLVALIEGAEKVTGEIASRRIDGTEFFVRFSTAIAESDATDWSRVWMTAEDITAEKRAEAILQQSHEDLEARVAERTEELSKANERLCREIAERKSADHALHESEARLQVVIDEYPSAFFVKDTEGRYVVINKAYERLFGITFEEAKGKTVHEFFPKDVSIPGTDILRRVIETGETVTIEEKLHYQGMPRSCLLVMFRIEDDDGKVVGVAGIGTDITERKALEDMLAYEFNTLLNAVTAFVGRADQSGQINEDVDWLAEWAGRSGWRGTEVIKRLLAHTFNEDEQPEPVVLNSVVAETDDILTGTLGDYVEIDHVLERELWPVEVDPQQIKYVLVNLALSASDAMPHGGALTIETANMHIDSEFAGHHPQARVGEFAMLAVAHGGNGMSPETLGQVFNPFFVTNAASDAAGVGLSALNSFAERSSGFVTVENGGGSGTRVALYLPRLETTSP